MPANVTLPVSPRSRAILQALFMTFLWSTSWVLIKIALHTRDESLFEGSKVWSLLRMQDAIRIGKTES